MQIQLLKAKLHRARVTEGSLNYPGSLGIDQDLMELAGIVPFEKILIGNVTTGDRFETYAIAAPRGSRTICLNGAVARLGQIGDLLVIMAFCLLSPEEAARWQPKTIVLSGNNEPATGNDSAPPIDG